MWWWSIVFVLVGAGLLALVYWLRNRNMETKWYDWLIGLVGLILFLWTWQNFAGSLREGFPQASLMFLLITGLPSLVLLGIPVIQVRRRNRAA